MAKSHENSLVRILTSLRQASGNEIFDFWKLRADFFSDLAALMPVLVHLGTDDTPHEIFEAVRDVTTWWP